MRVLIVSQCDSLVQGASLGAYRLLVALRENGVEAFMAVVKKYTTNPYVLDFEMHRTFLQKVVRHLKLPFYKYLRKHFVSDNKIYHSFNFESLMDIKKINDFPCDVVNLHWVGSDTLTIKDISLIKRPLVWTMHDSWSVCGAEHYQDILRNDKRYIQGYTRKNCPKEQRALDLCKRVWKQKKKYLSRKNIVWVAPSEWQLNVQKESLLFKSDAGFVIPNLLPKDIFYSKDKSCIKNILGIAKNKKVIGFGATNLLERRKGGLYLAQALKTLHKDKENYAIIVFGDAGNSEGVLASLGIEYHNIGVVKDKRLLASIYSSFDVFVCPSTIENLSYAILEAMHCGAGVVAFNAGGNCDMIEHKYNGYLAKAYDKDDLALGIKTALEHSVEYSKNALEKANRSFDNKKSVAMYIGAYSFCINRK